MSAHYNGRQLELLAPAGTFAILESLLDTGADAFYVGGKSLNMRLHRREFNLSDEELIAAADVCRSRGIRLYVTVNKLMGEDDLASAPAYLEFLARDVRPDAILVQDLAVPAIVAREGLPLPLHASVMMNAHNEAGIRALAGFGVSRVVLSREASLEDARRLFDATGMELEYFAHGDLCAAHGSQCLYSGMLYGLSGNRGLCMKPCRWPFSAVEGGVLHGSGFPLAVRDMCLYLDLKPAADSGISAFKIEGRMRSAGYLRPIISAYARSLSRLVATNSVVATNEAYDPNEGYKELFANRMRDFSTAFAYGRPGSSMLNTRWEGTGKFYSSGKVFSRAAAEPPSSGEDAARVSKVLRGNAPGRGQARRPELAVRVDTAELAAQAFDSGADVAILSGEPFDAAAGASGAVVAVAGLQSLRNRYPGRIIGLALPRMLEDYEYPEWERILADRAGLFDELYVTHLGADARFKPSAPRLAGDSSLNVLNRGAASFWADRGLSSVCASLEAGAADLAALVRGSPIPVELVVHGRPSAMYSSLDLATYVARLPRTDVDGAAEAVRASYGRAKAFGDNMMVLIDEKGAPHPLARDCRDKYHFLPTKALCLLDLVPALLELGVARFRIDGALYGLDALGSLCAAWRAALDGADPATVPMPPELEGSWLGALGPAAKGGNP